MKVTYLLKSTQPLRQAALSVLAAFSLGQSTTFAADHGDAPNVGPDQGADIADVYFFRDPGAPTEVVIIATSRGFIVPGEAVNFGIFDSKIRYRFEIENTGDAKPDRFIDVTFGPRLSTTAGQTATIEFTGFGLKGKKAIFTKADDNDPLAATAPNLNEAPPAQDIHDVTVAGSVVKFFAGEVDDPFFFDIPGFARMFGPLTDDDPATVPNFTNLGRGRDTFAGYNVTAIALRLPISMLGTPPDSGDYQNQIGVDFLAQRRVQILKKTGEIKSVGTWLNADRMGNPAVNVALIPFARKNEYNAATTLDDSKLKFLGDADHDDDGKKDPDTKQRDFRGIADTFANIEANLGAPIAATPTLAKIAILQGDFLRLNVTLNNTGDGGGNNAGSGFPNGRRLRDDVIDTYLFLLSNGAITPQAPGTPGGDNVIGNDVTLQNVFPFLAPSQQPRPRVPADPAQPDTNVDDNTRN